MRVNLRAKFEAVPQTETYSFAVREFILPCFGSPWHFHPEYELTCIVKSTGKRFVGDNIAPFGAGDLVLVGANLPHYWQTDPSSGNENNDAHSIVIQFREDCFGAEWLSKPELSSIKKLLLKARRGLWFQKETSMNVGPIMRGMTEMPPLDRLIALLNIFKILLDAKGCIELSSQGFSPILDEHANERINRVYQYVFKHFPEGLDHQLIAKETGLSLSALCHYFKKVTGRTLSDFINEVRIGHARKLLIDTDKTIVEIAYLSGYETLSNFNRCFHKLSGMSPSVYRRQHSTRF